MRTPRMKSGIRVRSRLGKKAARDRNAPENGNWRTLPYEKPLLARTQLWRDLNYVIVSWNGMIAGN